MGKGDRKGEREAHKSTYRIYWTKTRVCSTIWSPYLRGETNLLDIVQWQATKPPEVRKLIYSGNDKEERRHDINI